MHILIDKNHYHLMIQEFLNNLQIMQVKVGIVVLKMGIIANLIILEMPIFVYQKEIQTN